MPLTAPVEPVLRDGGWENANAGILGADNKAAVAALIELARICQRRRTAEVGVELLFTVSEETGLHGRQAVRRARSDSDFGYVFDHASPLGEIVIASPTHMRIVARDPRAGRTRGHRPGGGRSAIVGGSPGDRGDAAGTARR